MPACHHEPAGAAPDVFVIRDLETLRAVSDPLRLRLFELLRSGPRTVKQLAAALDLPPTRLYYHVGQLEAHGLVRVVDTRVVSGIIEKRYQAAAQRLSVDRALLAPGAEPDDAALETLLGAVLDEAREEVRRAARAGLIDPASEAPEQRGLLLGRVWLRLTPERAQDLYDRLLAVIDDLRNDPPAESEAAQVYELLLGLYPTVRDAER